MHTSSEKINKFNFKQRTCVTAGEGDAVHKRVSCKVVPNLASLACSIHQYVITPNDKTFVPCLP